MPLLLWGVWDSLKATVCPIKLKSQPHRQRGILRIMHSLQQRAQIEYDRRNGERPALLEIHWDTLQHCPVVIEGGYVVSMNDSQGLTLRNVLSQNQIYIEQMDGVVFGDPFDGELLDCLVEHLPVCQLTIRAPPAYSEYVYEPSMEAVMDEILEEIETARCTE